MKQMNRLKNFPITFLAIILGLTGFSLALQKAEQILNLPFSIFPLFLGISIITGIAFTIIYTFKIIKFPKEAKEEFNHPIKMNFYPIIAKVLLILSIIFLPLDMSISKVLWILGVISQLTFSIVIASSWIKHSKFQFKHLNPAWFIPIVGNLIVPIAGVAHGFIELSWFFFSIGFFMWLTLFIIVFNRMIFHHPIQEKLLPTLFILFAPPAIAFIAYVKLVGEIDIFAKMFFNFAIFLVILIFAQVKLFLKIKFYISWWAYTFPVVAISIATMLMYHETGSIFFNQLSWFFMILLSIIMVYVSYRTIKAIRCGHICVEEITE